MSDAIRRFPIYLLVECSESMVGDPIESVKSAIGAVHDELMNDPLALEIARLSVITFSDSASQVVPLTELAAFSVPDLVAGGRTALGAGLNLLMDCINSEVWTRGSETNFRDAKPLAFLFINRNPTDDCEAAAVKWKAEQTCNIISVAFSDAVDGEFLKNISENVLMIKTATPRKITELFKWVTQSVNKIQWCGGPTKLSPPREFTVMH